jgi:hypothetical protein
MLELPSQVFERAKLNEEPVDGEEPKEEGREKDKDGEKGKDGRRLLHSTLTPAQRRLSGTQDPTLCTPPGHPASVAVAASSAPPSVAREPGMVTYEHWTVDEDLPIHLRVQVPHSSRSLSHISPACVNVMESFFEVRPGLRFGTDIEALRNHPWFSENEIPDWSTLETKMYCPNFVPEKRFMQNTFWSPKALRHYREMAREDELNASRTAAVITAEEEHLLAEFDYNSPYFESLIDRRRRKSLEPGASKAPMMGGKPLSPTSGQVKPHMAVSCSAPALHQHQHQHQQPANKQTLPKIAF